MALDFYSPFFNRISNCFSPLWGKNLKSYWMKCKDRLSEEFKGASFPSPQGVVLPYWLLQNT